MLTREQIQREARRREEERVARVRSLDNNDLEDEVRRVTGARWFAVYDRDAALAALSNLENLHPERIEDFAQLLVEEVDPECSGVFYSAIECGVHGPGGASGPELVVRILRATPVQICRAIILAMPEKKGV